MTRLEDMKRNNKDYCKMLQNPNSLKVQQRLQHPCSAENINNE